MVGICVLSVRDLLSRCQGSAVGDSCCCCLPLGPCWLLSASSWKVIRYAAEDGVRLWPWMPADLLHPRGGFCVRGECCSFLVYGAR